MTKLTNNILKLLSKFNFKLDYLENIDQMHIGGLEGTKMIGNYLSPKKNRSLQKKLFH